MQDDSDGIDHIARAQHAISDAQNGVLEAGPERAGSVYAQIAIAHALIRIARALDRIGNDLEELKRR